MSPEELTPSLLRAYAPDPAPYRATALPAWLDEVDLSLSGGHARMGTRALTEDGWLMVDHLAKDEIRLRRRLLSEQRHHVSACSELAREAAIEVADLVEQWLERHVDPDDRLPAPDEVEPLARAGAQVQEDLCLMVRHHDAWRLEGAVLCFPSLWILAEKLGRPTSGVHEPVPYYAEESSQRVDTMFDRLPAGKLVWRRNVSVWPALILWAPCHVLDSSLHGHQSDGGPPPLWIRSERQTLRRLPDSGAILFTIRVQTVPIDVLADDPERARAMAAWCRAPIGAVRRGQMGVWFDPLLAWLDAVGAAP